MMESKSTSRLSTHTLYSEQQPPQTVSRGVGYDPSNYTAPSRQQTPVIQTGSGLHSKPRELTRESIAQQIQNSSYATRNSLNANQYGTAKTGSTTQRYLSTTQNQQQSGVAGMMLSHEDGSVQLYGSFSTPNDFYNTSQPYNKSIPSTASGITSRSQISGQKPSFQHQTLQADMTQPGYFFDSPSKYVSLKQYKQRNNVVSTNTQQARQQRPYQDPSLKYGKSAAQHMLSGEDMKIKDWFEKLTLQEKSIVCTVVDKQLVSLIFQMYKVYEEERSVKFFNRHESAHLDPHLINKVKQYNLWYKKRPGGFQYDSNVTYLKKIETAEEALVTNVRLLNLLEVSPYAPPKEGSKSGQNDKKKGAQNQVKKHPQIEALIQQERNRIGGSDYIKNFDTLTIDVKFLETVPYFFELMRSVNGHTRHYLSDTLIISKDIKRLDHSVFYQEGSNNKNPEKMPAHFTTFVPKHEEFKEITLGQCLALIFEKAINVQYYDYQNKLQAGQLRYFFLPDTQLENNVFLKDQTLSAQWMVMNSREREDLVRGELAVIEREMMEEEHRPVKAAILGNTLLKLGQGDQMVLESVHESDQSSQEEEDAHEDEEEGMPRKRQVRKAQQRMNHLFTQDEEDPFSRTRGIASSKYQIKLGSHGQIQAACAKPIANPYYDQDMSDGNDEEAPGIFEDKNKQSSDVSEEEELADIERMGARQMNKQGAVGKLKNKVNDARSKFAPHYHQDNTSLQEKEDNYSADSFEQDEEGSHQQSSYFMDNEYNRRKSQATHITSQFRDQMIDSLENPLMIDNKFFFVKSQLNRFLQQGLSEHSDLDKVESHSLRFFKNLSTFISLPIVSVTSLSLICPITNRMESFSKPHQDTDKKLDEESPKQGAISIPIKQRLYERLYKHIEDKRWKELSEMVEDSTQQVNKGTVSIGQMNRQLQQSVQQVQGGENATVAVGKKSSVGQKSSQPPQLDILAQSQFSKMTPASQKQTKPSQPQPQPAEAKPIPETQPSSKQPSTDPEQPAAAATTGNNTAANKNKKKKKKEKEKAKKLAAAAALAQGLAEGLQPSTTEANPQTEAIKQIHQEANTISIVKSMLQKSAEKAANQQYQDAQSAKMNALPALPVPFAGFYLDIPGDNNRYPSLATITPHKTLEDQFGKIETLQNLTEYKEQRTSLMSNQFIEDKYRDEKILEEIRKQEAMTSHQQMERELILNMKKRLTEGVPPSNTTTSPIFDDPTVDRSVVHQHQRTIQQIVYGATAETTTNQLSDVEMADETATAMEAKYPAGDAAAVANKKKKRNKKKKKNKKDKAGKEGEESKADAGPIEIEMIELKPKSKAEVEEEDQEEVKTPVKKDRIYFNKEFEGIISKPHSQKGGSVHNMSSSPIYKSLIGTPSDVRRELDENKRVGEGIGQFISDIQRFIDEKTSSLINTTLETIRQEELDDFPEQNDQEESPVEPKEEAKEESNQPTISEVTEVIDLKKQPNEEEKIIPAIKELEIIAPSKNKKNGNQGKKGKKGGANHQNAPAKQQDPQQSENHQVVAGLTIIGGTGVKLNKKQQKIAKMAAKKAQLAEKKTAEDLAKQQDLEEVQKYHLSQLEQHPLPKVDTLTQELITGRPADSPKGSGSSFLNNENLQILERQLEKGQVTPDKSERSKKSVGFRGIANTAPRQPSFFQYKPPHDYNSSSAEDGQGIEDNVKIPKRGSSRGSSCTEEAIHQSTINMLGDLFPQEYKNPSDDTKLRISKITTSSSGASNKDSAGSINGSPDIILGQSIKKAGAAVSKFLEEPYPSLDSVVQQVQTGPQKKRGKGGHRVPLNANLNQASPRDKHQSLHGKKEYEGYEAMFQEAYQATSLQKEELLVAEDAKSETLLHEEEKVSADVPLQIPPQSSTPTPQTEKLPIAQSTSQQKHKNKKNKNQQPSSETVIAGGSTSNLKEMKERGAIARPVDIEHAARKGTNQQKKDKQRNAQAPIPSSETSLIPPSVAVNIQRTQTPGAQLEAQSLLPPQQNVSKNQIKNAKNGTGAQVNGKASQNNTNNGKNQHGQNLGGTQNQQPNPKRKQGPNGQQTAQGAGLQQNPNHRVNQQHNLSPPQSNSTPSLFEFQHQQQQLFDQSAAQQQQQQLQFQHQHQHAILAHQQQLLQQQTQIYQALAGVGPATHNLFNNFPSQSPAPFQQPNFGLPNFNTSTHFLGGGLPQAAQNLGFGLDEQSNTMGNNYQVSSVQTGGNTTQMDESFQQMMMSQQTQTEEQQNQAQVTAGQNQQQQPIVMHQYQNIHLQVHMPPAQNNQGSQQQFMQAPNSLMMPQNFMDQSFGNANTGQFFQNQLLYNPMFGLNPLLAPQLSHLTPPTTQAPGLYGDYQNQFNLQSNLLFNPLMQGLYQPPAQPSPSATLLGQIPSVPTHHSPNLLGATHMPQLGRTNRLNSMPPLPFVGHSGFPSGPNQFQHFLDMLLQSANGGSNMNQSNPWPMMGGASSNVSHMSQDQYEEQAFVTQKTDQFYTKLDQEIYKLQNKIKFKLQGIEPERQSALRRIESSIKDTYSECPNARVEMYGSMATGLAIDSSDMDLLVSGVFTNMMQQDIQKHVYFPRPPLSVVDRSLLVEQMKRLFRELTNMESSNQGVTALKECLEDVKIIETASVPVIKLVIDLQKIREIENRVASSTTQIDDDMRLLKIDITFNDLQSESLDLGFFAQGFQPLASTIHMGIRCCQFVKKKLEEYQILESLTLVLKKFLALRNMNQPYQGGLNSYGLIILIVTYLNLNLPDFYNKEGQLSAARVLKHFLSYFGRHFDSNYYIINEQQQIVPEINYSSILVIRDPLNPMNNIGKSTFNFDNIRAEFARAHDEIERHLQEFIQNSSAAEEQATSEEAKAGKSSVVWKKRLDILSKILTPDTFAGAFSVAEAHERGSPSPKTSHAITESSVNPENEQKNQEENQEQ